MSPSSPKMLLVFCDGTGADGTLTGTEIHAPRQFATNVLRLSRAVLQTSTYVAALEILLQLALKKTRSDNQKRQIVLYLSGVGSESDFNEASGVAVASKIRDAYAFIAQNFEVGDEICIFGYATILMASCNPTEESFPSRGAYTARKLSGLIDRVGLLEREELGNFFKIWSALVKGQRPIIPPGTHSTRIKCVGVWDTVDAVYNYTRVKDALSIADPSLPASIDIALHALSLQENRDLFLPTLWEMPKGGWRDNQVWFPGSHCNVGGGLDKHDLSDLALFWMVGEIKSFINIDTSFIEKIAQPKPDPWGAALPQNGYMELSKELKRIFKPQTRLEGCVIKPDAVFHESILFAPATLPSPQYMLTLDTLKKVFGSSWKPAIAPLNEFEQSCKDKWGKQSERIPMPIMAFLERFQKLLPSRVHPIYSLRYYTLLPVDTG
ncbi:hypothetical protein EV401DRAFT_2065503 [Pisolithus croceorrhizus]|nr:hypothetical protein EV401DRAFT_2065503 [Pisolithus croceorrhizus]